MWRGVNLLVEQVDAKEMKEGEDVTFVNWGNIKVFFFFELSVLLVFV